MGKNFCFLKDKEINKESEDIFNLEGSVLLISKDILDREGGVYC